MRDECKDDLVADVPEACGVLIGNCCEFVVAALAIWKAGKTVVLLDPNWPEERLAMVVSACPITQIVTIEPFRQKAANILPPSVVTIIDLEPELTPLAASSPKGAIPGGRHPDTSAYVIFTSGSTGRPKGVPISHANLAQLLAWQQGAFDLGPQYTSLQLLPVTFDFGFEEVLNQVCFGGHVHFAEPAEAIDPERYARKAAAIGANLLYVTPSQLEFLLSVLDLENFRMILIGGEAFPWRLWDRLAPALTSERRIFNGYGPTETTITATAHRLSPSDRWKYATALSVPIGVPCADSRIHIVDPADQLCPPGVPGEIVISGGGVSAGYLGAPAEQSARFGFVRFSASMQTWAFRTGDIAKFHHDGLIEFLGRSDGQVKVNGFRVETEEIAEVLRSAGALQVVVDHDPSGGKPNPLAAYCIFEAGTGTNLRALYRAAAARLPIYARPRIVQVDALPLTPNGKPDTATLRALHGIRAVEDTGLAAGAKARLLKDEILDVWRHLLSAPFLAPQDDVFEYGANSLVILQAQKDIERRVELRIELPALFTYRSAEALAEHLRDVTSHDSAAPDATPSRRNALAFQRLRRRRAVPRE
ncbi:amino acid adenylation domain-containing protein [Bradyrhizobium sp. SZCCHNR1051]|uniref:amino acid adenylation domain-containing protein n=1 Tax=Bradyrhizobium sp. SZCCHNR1051 TaxID=3057355 RepID=UPI002915CA4C|nr:amino acid adenylation domain-containing protein [Bradyrhizobium sp. SZCCHNR1051]